MPASLFSFGGSAIALAISAALIVCAYLLKVRTRTRVVAFSKLWTRALPDRQRARMVRSIRDLLSLALSLSVPLILFFAMLQPWLNAKRNATTSHLAIIIDASASMQANDVERPFESRLDQAKAMARELIRQQGPGTAVMVMRMDHRPLPLSNFRKAHENVQDSIDGIEASDAPADLRGALALARDSLRGALNPKIVLVSDGAFSSEALKEGEAIVTSDSNDEDSIATQFMAVGKSGDNVGIIGFNVRRYQRNKLNYEVYLSVENFSSATAHRRLIIERGDTQLYASDLTIEGNRIATQIIPDLSGEDPQPLRARLVESPEFPEPDHLAVDDVAFAVLPTYRESHVLLVSEGNLYLEGALLVIDSVTFDRVSPEQYQGLDHGTLGSRYRVVIFDSVTPSELPKDTHRILFNPKGASSPFKTGKNLANAQITQVYDSHPASRFLSLKDAHFDSLTTLIPTRELGDTTIANSLSQSVAIARENMGVKTVAWGFDLASTDLVLRVAFPVLLINALDWFAGVGTEVLHAAATGRSASFPAPEGLPQNLVMQTTGGVRQTSQAFGDGMRFEPAQVGVYRAAPPSADEPLEFEIAANLVNRDESRIAPNSALPFASPYDKTSQHSSPTWMRMAWSFLVLFVMLLVAFEWLSTHRRWTS